MTPSHGVEIVYEDNHILVAVKPYNIPSQQDSSGDADMLNILKEYIKQKYDKPGNVYLGLVHRLDRPAGGLMLFARTSKAASRLSDAMRKQAIEKSYQCRCTGIPQPPEGDMRDLLVKDEKTNNVHVVHHMQEKAKQAELRYRVVEDDGQNALCEVELKTGRPHQIRVQFASRGHALVGDARYGSGGRQLALWAFRLAFTHPVQHEWMEFVYPPNPAL